MRKAIFLDKDGTLIRDIPYNVDPSLITLEESLVEGLQHLQSRDYLLIIISNQSGIAHGYFTSQQLHIAMQKIEALLYERQLVLDGFYYCPHHPDGSIADYSYECTCRKPKPGLIFKAASEMNIDLDSSWMIGDILNDVEAGNKAGCNTILIDNGNETEWLSGYDRTPAYTAKNINDAAVFILQHKLKGIEV